MVEARSPELGLPISPPGFPISGVCAVDREASRLVGSWYCFDRERNTERGGRENYRERGREIERDDATLQAHTHIVFDLLLFQDMQILQMMLEPDLTSNLYPCRLRDKPG